MQRKPNIYRFYWLNLKFNFRLPFTYIQAPQASLHVYGNFGVLNVKNNVLLSNEINKYTKNTII